MTLKDLKQMNDDIESARERVLEGVILDNGIVRVKTDEERLQDARNFAAAELERVRRRRIFAKDRVAWNHATAFLRAGGLAQEEKE